MTKKVKLILSNLKTIGKIIRDLRESKGLPLRKVAAYLDIDQAVLSKIERGLRKINKEQIQQLSIIFEIDDGSLLLHYYSDKIAYELAEEPFAIEALKLSESKIDYLRNLKELK